MSRPRLFDWDEAKRLRGEGLTYGEISRRLGVSSSAVVYACDGRQRAMNENQKAEWQRGGTCIDCGGPSSRTGGKPERRCKACHDVYQVTTVRATTLRCQTCHQWKPDNEFAHNRIRGCEQRRGRHRQCRACSLAARQAYRVNGKVPCDGRCGALVEGRGRSNAYTDPKTGERVRLDPGRPYLCRKCASRQAAA